MICYIIDMLFLVLEGRNSSTDNNRDVRANVANIILKVQWTLVK